MHHLAKPLEKEEVKLEPDISGITVMTYDSDHHRDHEIVSSGPFRSFLLPYLSNNPQDPIAMSFVRPITNLARVQIRPLSTTARHFSLSKPVLTQGHATKKAKDPIHKDKDIQSSAVRGGSQNKNEARDNSVEDGENQPFDAARQGNTGGEKKGASAEGTGSFKDQVGGQGAGGVKKGQAEDASGESYTDMAKNALSGNFGKGAKASFPHECILVTSY